MPLSVEDQMKQPPEIKRLIRLNDILYNAHRCVVNEHDQTPKRKRGVRLPRAWTQIQLVRDEITELIQNAMEADPNNNFTYGHKPESDDR